MRQVVHDLNNHIAALLSFCEIVLDELPAKDTLRSRIEAIRTIGQYAVVRTIPDAARVAQVTEHVAQVRTLAFGALAEVKDTGSALHADVFEIATAAEAAFTVLSQRVRACA
jgi:hypothetical protein